MLLLKLDEQRSLLPLVRSSDLCNLGVEGGVVPQPMVSCKASKGVQDCRSRALSKGEFVQLVAPVPLVQSGMSLQELI